MEYDLTVFKQECKHCKCKATGKIFESQIQIVAKMFCFMVAKVLTLEPHPENKPFRQKHEDDN